MNHGRLFNAKSSLYKYIKYINNFLHSVKFFQELPYNSHNLKLVIWLHTVCSIWPIDRTLTGATTPGQSEPGSNGNEAYSTFPKSLRLETHYQVV